ncbi:MAG TPA: trigger factor [Terriglobales bacterium]|nr:trigger factor [Terriglobales bacterium]
MNTENPTTETPETQPGAPPQPQEDPYAACRQQLTIEIPADAVAEEEEQLVQRFSKEARVAGFRKGKVPASIVRSRFSEQVREQLLENLVPQYYRVAVMSGGYKPISSPHISDLHAEPGEPIRFTASFDVAPEFELGDYKSVKVEKPEINVTDEQVDSELRSFQERQASYDPVDEERPLKDGDFAQVSFQARPVSQSNEEAKPNPPQPVQMDEVLVEIGGPTTIKEFSENLRGGKAGEERTFQVSYPADFHDKRLAGSVLSYQVKINAIKKKTLPELNDAFAKELSPEFETLDQFKKSIRENMESQLRHQAEHEGKEKLIEELIAKHDFPVPGSMVEHQIDLRLERGLRALASQGMKTEDMRRLDFKRLRAAQRDGATKEVRSGLLLNKIADTENIQISEEELDQEILSLAAHTHQTPDEVRKQLTQDQGLERIRARMRSEKALNFLYGQGQ